VRGARTRIVAVRLRAAGRRHLGKRRHVSVRVSVLASDRAGRTAKSERIDLLRIVHGH
jgi:hypothetical protein